MLGGKQVLVQLTKRVVAQRQLVASIRLLYDGADLVPVYSLAANAWEIIDTLATRAGIDSISNQTREHIPLGKDLKSSYINSPYRNFFKHADNDPDASLPPLKDENVESIIFSRLRTTCECLECRQLSFKCTNSGILQRMKRSYLLML